MHALVLGREARQRRRAVRAGGDNRNEAVVLVAGRPAQAEADLGLDPVHDALAAEVDRERGRAALDRLFELGLPGLAGPEVVLVEPDPQARLFRRGYGLDTPLERASRLAVDAGVAEEQQGRAPLR